MRQVGPSPVRRPSVSIVTPCLNPGKRLVRCLDSVAAQTYPHVEHIVIDGGSTDETGSTLRERGTRFVSEPDRGQAEAINKGFALARGDWLGWLNADDALTPSSVESAVEAAESAPEAGWVWGDYLVWESGADRRRTVKGPERLDLATLEWGGTIGQPGSLVARWALEAVGPLDETLDLAMDYDLWLRLVDAGVPSVYVPETLAIFEVHSASKTGRLGRSPWWFECGKALAGRGHPESAALMLGRAAAELAREPIGPIGRSALESSIADVAERAEGELGRVDRRRLRAAAYAEAALLDLHLRPRAFRNLLAVEPWLVRKTAARLLSVLGRGILRRLRVPA